MKCEYCRKPVKITDHLYEYAKKPYCSADCSFLAEITDLRGQLDEIKDRLIVHGNIDSQSDITSVATLISSEPHQAATTTRDELVTKWSKIVDEIDKGE